jgi:filamentous hemagglutinin
MPSKGRELGAVVCLKAQGMKEAWHLATLRDPLTSGVASPAQLAIRQRVLANIADSQAARAASRFGEHANFETAFKFYSEGGWSTDRALSHIGGIDLTRPVTVVELPAGTSVIQYQYPSRPVGNYFAPVGTPAETLGIDPVGRVCGRFTAGSNVPALRSTAATVTDWAGSGQLFGGGGTQFFTHAPGSFVRVP